MIGIIGDLSASIDEENLPRLSERKVEGLPCVPSLVGTEAGMRGISTIAAKLISRARYADR
jgi:hypothetical protein